MNNTELNIYNLTHLWKVAGQAFQSFKNTPDYSISSIENSEWPNRIWANKTLTQATIQEIKWKMEKHDGLIFSCFSEGTKKNLLPTNNGFLLKSTQYGMSLPLTSKFKIERKIDFKQVSNEANTELWSTTFFEAFKYRISVETILRTSQDIQYFLASYQQKIIGTIVLFVTNNTAGIHSLGIVPSQRKKGFATDIMHHILNMSIEQNSDSATLQASEMAKEMYLKMGFTNDFVMKNYTLKQ